MTRCPQCWQEKPPAAFVNRAGYTVKRCATCREKYRDWEKLTDEEKRARTNSRAGLVTDRGLRVRLVLRSHNRKTGPIPVTMTSAQTCPPSCAFFGNGCYAEQHLTGHHWRTLSDGRDPGLSWGDFCWAVAELPAGQVWRHNEAGDLPGVGEAIDVPALLQLVAANAGRRGFTYTHKPMFSHKNQQAVHEANRNGFTVNLSADSLAQADDLASLKIGPVVVTVPHDTPNGARLRTPQGRHVVLCPAEKREEVTCSTCKLCAVPTRKSIVGFRAHGNNRYAVTTRMRQLPLFGGARG